MTDRYTQRLNQVIVNNEVTEVSNKTLLQELQDSRATISRLTAHHARSIGWDTRITAALKERDDMQQERDSESHRARLAESRFAALKDKTSMYPPAGSGSSVVTFLQANCRPK